MGRRRTWRRSNGHIVVHTADLIGSLTKLSRTFAVKDIMRITRNTSVTFMVVTGVKLTTEYGKDGVEMMVPDTELNSRKATYLSRTAKKLLDRSIQRFNDGVLE